jgi:predicted nucleic acid-binding Zn ribbon protein
MTNEGDGAGGMALNKAIGAWLSSAGLGELSRLSRVSSCWAEVVGGHVAEHVRPLALEEGTLVVEVDDPSWATELVFLSAPVLDALRQRLGEPVAERLKARVRGHFGVE